MSFHWIEIETCSTAGCRCLQGTIDDCAAVYEWMKGGIKLIYSLIDGVAVNSQHTGQRQTALGSRKQADVGQNQNILKMQLSRTQNKTRLRRKVSTI